MVTTYGSFPGVRVEVSGGGITSIAIGAEEKLVLFGRANYQNDDPTWSNFTDGDEDPLVATLSGTAEEPSQINARREADTTFGDGSELADAMRESLANGANIEFVYGVAPKRINVIGETASTQSGNLANAPIYEDDVSDDSNIVNIRVTDDTESTTLDVEYTYDGTPTAPASTGDDNTIRINPLTGEFAADEAPGSTYTFDYKYLDWQSAFEASAVTNIVLEEDTGIFVALSDADSVASTLSSQVTTLRGNYQLVNGLSGAEPNDNQLVTTDDAGSIDYSAGNYQRRDARFDTSTYSSSNVSVDSDSYFLLAPVREEDQAKTILGGVGGLFAGNPISDPIYNDSLTGYDALEQSFTKSDADVMRNANVIPVRQAGSIRVKDNLSTSTETDWERDFWRRRIADRVILIAKQVGDAIIGRINDEATRDAAGRLIRAELRELVNDRLIKGNTDGETNWFVDVYEDSSNPNEVNIDVGFTPYGIVKRVDESITINT